MQQTQTNTPTLTTIPIKLTYNTELELVGHIVDIFCIIYSKKSKTFSVVSDRLRPNERDLLCLYLLLGIDNESQETICSILKKKPNNIQQSKHSLKKRGLIVTDSRNATIQTVNKELVLFKRCFFEKEFNSFNISLIKNV